MAQLTEENQTVEQKQELRPRIRDWVMFGAVMAFIFIMLYFPEAVAYLAKSAPIR